VRPYVPTAPPPTLSVCFLYLNFVFTSLPCPFAFLCTSLLSITSSPSTLLLPSPAPINLAEVFETMPGYSKHRCTLKRVANETFPTCIDRGASFEKAFLGFQEQIKQLEPRDAKSQVFFGVWWIYDAAQAIFNRDIIKVYGLGVPGLGPKGIACGVLAKDEPSPPQALQLARELLAPLCAPRRVLPAAAKHTS
jgi:hypothetical protein